MQAADIAILVSHVLISGSGIFLNILVTSTSFRAWHNDGFQSSQDLIVFCMGLSCTVFSSFQFSVDMSSYIWKSVFQSPNLCLLYILSTYTVSIFFILSMTAWLCIFYCVKIVSLHNRLLITIKSRFLAFLPHVTAGTFVVSSILLILLICINFTSVPLQNVDNSTIYCRKLNDTLMDNVLFISNMFNFSIAGPFLLILLSLGAAVTSLVRHVRRIQLSTNLDNTHTKAHINAVKIMSLLLLLNVSFYLSSVMLHWKLLIGIDFLNWICVVIYYIFWPLQALILLFRNPKSSSVAFTCFCRCLYID